MKPVVTIAIATYERLWYLKEAVASALAQTYDSFEVLVGDDGLTSEIAAWCNSQAQQEPRLRYQKNSRNLGLAGNWNALVDNARGDFIVIVGDDDRLLPEFVQRTVAAATRHNAAVSFSDHFVIDVDGNRLDGQSELLSQAYYRKQLRGGVIEEAETSAWQNAVPMSAALIRTEAARRLRFKEDLNNPEIELFIRLAQRGGKFTFVKEFLSEYRVHSGSTTASTGLRSERLVNYLVDIQVRPEVEKWKARLLNKLIVNAVSRLLLAGDCRAAREWLGSKYYPSRERLRLRGLVQMACASAPRVLGVTAYRIIWHIKMLRGSRISSTA